MKKYLCVIFVVFIAILIIFGNYDTLESRVSSTGVDYVNLGNGVIEIDANNYDDFINELDVDIISKFEVSDRVIIEGYSPRIKDYLVINGFKVNVQISISDDSVIIGSPLINGSFWKLHVLNKILWSIIS